MSELFRVLVTLPDGKSYLAVNRTENSKWKGSKYFSRQSADRYVQVAEQVNEAKKGNTKFKVLADGEGFYTL